MNRKPVFTVPMRTQVNFKSKFGQKTLCGDGSQTGPTFTAGQACAYSCVYCYVDSMQTKMVDYFKRHGVVYGEDGHFGMVIRNENAAVRIWEQLQKHPIAEREKHKVIYASPKVDVAANMELVQETVEICKVILGLTRWDIRLLSKSNLLPKVAQGLYEWYDKRNPRGETTIDDDPKVRVIYGVSTGTLDDKLCKAIEVGTPLVSKRIESLHWLQDNGYRTFGMICPSLPQADGTEKSYGLFAHAMYHAIRADRCEEVWAEPINLRGKSFTNTVAALEANGFAAEAKAVAQVSANKQAWEEYARQTFLGHARMPYRQGQLRFLQYVDNSNRDWWKDRVKDGAVLLGKEAN